MREASPLKIQTYIKEKAGALFLVPRPRASLLGFLVSSGMFRRRPVLATSAANLAFWFLRRRRQRAGFLGLVFSKVPWAKLTSVRSRCDTLPEQVENERF